LRLRDESKGGGDRQGARRATRDEVLNASYTILLDKVVSAGAMGRIELLSVRATRSNILQPSAGLRCFHVRVPASADRSSKSPAIVVLRTINHMNPADRAAAVRANVPAVMCGTIHNHWPFPVGSDCVRARTGGRTFDTDWHGALSDSLEGV
jgi:hypothetical protein